MMFTILSVNALLTDAHNMLSLVATKPIWTVYTWLPPISKMELTKNQPFAPKPFLSSYPCVSIL